MSITNILYISFSLVLLQMCWGLSSRKWLKLPQTFPSITIIFQLSPALTVSVNDDWICSGIPIRKQTILTVGTLNVFCFVFSAVLVRDVVEDIEKLIPSFKGVKFSACDLMDFGRCVSYSPPHWSLLYGVDEVSFFSPYLSICFGQLVVASPPRWHAMTLSLKQTSVLQQLLAALAMGASGAVGRSV